MNYFIYYIMLILFYSNTFAMISEFKEKFSDEKVTRDVDDTCIPHIKSCIMEIKEGCNYIELHQLEKDFDVDILYKLLIVNPIKTLLESKDIEDLSDERIIVFIIENYGNGNISALGAIIECLNICQFHLSDEAFNYMLRLCVQYSFREFPDETDLFYDGIKALIKFDNIYDTATIRVKSGLQYMLDF